jgi:hypothetical protein
MNVKTLCLNCPSVARDSSGQIYWETGPRFSCVLGVNSFHEKAGECQTFLSFFLSSSLFLLFPNCSHRAKPPLSPPFHPHSLLSDGRPVQVGCTRFSRCCYLIIDLYSPL